MYGNFTRMNMTMMTIDRKTVMSGSLVCIALLLSVILSIRAGEENDAERAVQLQTFFSGDGWGYDILIDGKVFIHQPTVPAIDTVMPFPDEESARRIGMLVMERLADKKDISVSLSDI